MIHLRNRDGATMWLENIHDDIWKLKVDKDHEYCLQYMRCGGDFTFDENRKIHWNKIEMIDPSGGPYLEVGDYVDDKYKIIEILDCTLLRLGERNND